MKQNKDKTANLIFATLNKAVHPELLAEKSVFDLGSGLFGCVMKDEGSEYVILTKAQTDALGLSDGELFRMLSANMAKRAIFAEPYPKPEKQIGLREYDFLNGEKVPQEDGAELYGRTMFVLADKDRGGGFGASIIFGEGVAAAVANALGSGYYAMMPDIHECVIVPIRESANAAFSPTLHDMAHSCLEATPQEEKLTDQVFVYDPFHETIIPVKE